jgi:uncharacterized protein (TIGR03118 family)
MLRKPILWSLLFTPVTIFAAGANVYIQHNLVSDQPGVADVSDPNLVNPWGVSESATSPFWVSNTGKGNSTLYNGSGAITPLVVTIPPGAAATSAQGTPTGQVQNSTAQFLLPNGNKASFIFSTEDGTISAWNGGTAATITVDNSKSGAVYYGLAIGVNVAGSPLLYAPNFTTGKIEVYDGKFAPTTVSGGFADSNLPAGYAPFNIWPIAGKLYVAYAKQGPLSGTPGVGIGQVAVFDFDGNLQKHLISGGALNAPWGMAIAPSTFGAFGGALLVGNFGDGKINAFDLSTGTALGTLQDSSGNPIVNAGLWALLFGNGANGGDKNTLYFTAGIGGLAHGLFGAIAPPASILSVVNAASGLSGPIAPGEVVVLTGISMGPSPLVANSIPASGAVSRTAGGVTVTVNGALAPILYASASQIGIIAPYELGGFSTANIVVTYKGQQITTQVPAPVALSDVGVFTLNFSGTGQATALNADGTVNSAANPDPAGSVIVLFATGEGPEYPPGEDGVINDRVLRVPQLPVSLTIGGQAARVLYAGTAIGQVQGVMQVEALVPAGLSGNVPVLLTVGFNYFNITSQPNVTIAVK